MYQGLVLALFGLNDSDVWRECKAWKSIFYYVLYCSNEATLNDMGWYEIGVHNITTTPQKYNCTILSIVRCSVGNILYQMLVFHILNELR